LAYIASSLVKEKFQVSILDCFLEKRMQSVSIGKGLFRIGLSDVELAGRIKEMSPDVIGISIGFSRQFQSAINVASLVRYICGRIPIVAGGAHVSAAPESLNESDFDYLVVGEGERSFPKLLHAIDRNHGSELAVPGIFHRDQNHIFRASLPPEFIPDLDSLPFPAYDLLPLRKAWRKRVPYANIMATRGCPHNCSFCSIHSVMGRRIRRRSIENVISEIELLVYKFDVREVFFEDDNLTSKMTWAKQLFQRLSHLKVDIEIGVRNGIRADKVDRELLDLMRKAGCARVCFAPESGSQDTLDNIIGKGLKLEDVEKAVKLAHSIGLNVTCFFVIGLPGETKTDIQRTIDFGRKLRRLGCDSVDINCATPYPGTRLYAECISKGFVDEKTDYSRLHTWESIISTRDFSAKEVTLLRSEAMKDLKESFEEKVERGLNRFIHQPMLFTKRKIRRLISCGL
jgi:magnesium-protoporphyrin IX monomethyl ester (oxidative) cyclase